MDSCDILIVGGGPAGSSCAWALRSSGLDVMLLDKSVFPRNKICGGWITPFVLEELEIDPQEYARSLTLQPINGFRVSCLGGREVHLPYRETVSYGIRRCEFDEYLLRRSGARLREGTAISTIERDGHGWLVNGEIRARVLVGAGGHFCPVARWMGNSNAEDPVVAQEIEFEMQPEQAASCGFQPQVPELYFCRDLKGYAWCFRKNNFLNIGLGRLDQHKLRDHVSGFIEFLRSQGKLAFDLPGRLAGHAYLLYGYSRRKIVDDSVLLIGDAAGLAYAQSGEGIRPAVESGLMAAGFIRSGQPFAAYQQALQQRFANGTGAERVSKFLPLRLRNALARMLLSTQWFCRKTVVDRWFLHVNDAPLSMRH